MYVMAARVRMFLTQFISYRAPAWAGYPFQRPVVQRVRGPLVQGGPLAKGQQRRSPAINHAGTQATIYARDRIRAVAIRRRVVHLDRRQRIPTFSSLTPRDIRAPAYHGVHYHDQDRAMAFRFLVAKAVGVRQPLPRRDREVLIPRVEVPYGIVDHVGKRNLQFTLVNFIRATIAPELKDDLAERRLIVLIILQIGLSVAKMARAYLSNQVRRVMLRARN